jgi:TPR repeat protein
LIALRKIALQFGISAILFATGCGEDHKDMERIYNLGTTYYFGLNGEKINHEKACDLFEEAANSGFSLAQFNLGNCYRMGEGKKNDLPQL